jgi:hypothetical protein
MVYRTYGTYWTDESHSRPYLIPPCRTLSMT